MIDKDCWKCAHSKMIVNIFKNNSRVFYCFHPMCNGGKYIEDRKENRSLTKPIKPPEWCPLLDKQSKK